MMKKYSLLMLCVLHLVLAHLVCADVPIPKTPTAPKPSVNAIPPYDSTNPAYADKNGNLNSNHPNLDTNMSAPQKPKADPRPGAQSSSPQASMEIRIDSIAKSPKLIISRRVLEELNNLAENNNTTAASAFRLNLTATQTIVSGVLMSLAFAFGGIWLVRSRNQKAKSSKTLVGVLLILLVGLGTIFVYADAADPRLGIDVFTGRTLSLDVRRNGRAMDTVIIGIADETSTHFSLRIPPDIELIVPQDYRDRKAGKADDEDE